MISSHMHPPRLNHNKHFLVKETHRSKKCTKSLLVLPQVSVPSITVPTKSHLQALLPQTMQLCLVSLILILQVCLSLQGLGAQGLHLQHQDLSLPGQHQELSVWAFGLMQE